MVFQYFGKSVNSLLCINKLWKSRKIIESRHFSVYNKLYKNTENCDIFDAIESDTTENREYEELAQKYFITAEQTCFIIHPYIKWGPKKKTATSPQNELTEAASLVKSLAGWSVTDQTIIALERIDKKTIFASGNLEKLTRKIRSSQQISAVFINVSTLKNLQINELERIFGVPILDRYKIVMQILKQHAISKHAQLQVALAEIPYLRARLRYIEIGTSHNWQVKDRMLADREIKLKKALKKLRGQRELLRNKRRDLDIPVVAVVGYTNAGKTSLIKCLTGDRNLQPKNQLFATLDVTAHSGLLPSKMQVLYIDTVGFISEIPTDLIECFIATLEDALLADAIIHVQDTSNEEVLFQRKHVEATLNSLTNKIGNEQLPTKIISVGNKVDIARNIPEIIKTDSILVSAKTTTGMDRNIRVQNLKESGIDILLEKIQSMILKHTGRRSLTLRVPNGGDEMRWLFKNSTVVEQEEDPKDSQFQFLKIIITQAKVKQFHLNFVARK